MFSSKCCLCDSQLVADAGGGGAGRSVLLSCNCLLSICQHCARKQLSERIVRDLLPPDDSIVCPACSCVSCVGLADAWIKVAAKMHELVQSASKHFVRSISLSISVTYILHHLSPC